MRAALFAILLLLTGEARADGPRLWAGPAVALDPVYAAAAAGADWFVSSHGALGVSLAQTVGGGDQLAVESGYGFADAIGRLRGTVSQRLSVEALAGAGIARVRFGSPGAHTELAPELTLGAALGLALAARWELAIELGTHVTFGARSAARNTAHTSELLVVALRWGG
jgi:hypothetical protein